MKRNNYTKELKELSYKIELVASSFEEFESEGKESEEYKNNVLKVFKFEEQISEKIEGSSKHDLYHLKTFQQRLTQIKRFYDFYDEEAELDRMLPFRYEVFDEDSI